MVFSDDWMKTNGFTDSQFEEQKKQEEAQWGGAAIKDLTLPDAVTVNENTSCAATLDILNKGGFDQVPVVDDHGGLVGLITIGSLLSKTARGRINPADPVKSGMFAFDKTRSFREITMETKLADLKKFFEKNTFAVVTARDQNNKLIVKKVVTKIDLVQYLMAKKN